MIVVIERKKNNKYDITIEAGNEIFDIYNIDRVFINRQEKSYNEGERHFIEALELKEYEENNEKIIHITTLSNNSEILFNILDELIEIEKKIESLKF